MKRSNHVVRQVLRWGEQGLEVMAWGISRLPRPIRPYTAPLWWLHHVESRALERMMLSTAPFLRRIVLGNDLSEGYWLAVCPLCSALFSGKEWSALEYNGPTNDKGCVKNVLGHLESICPSCYRQRNRPTTTKE